MKYCKDCGSPLSDGAAFCPKCGAKQGRPSQLVGAGENARFSSWNLAPLTEITEIVITLLIVAWLWSIQGDLPALFYAGEKMAIRAACFLILVLSLPFSIMSILQKKQVCLQLEEEGISGVWIRSQLFLVRVEPFRLSYHEIEDTRVQGMGTGCLNLKVRGRWKIVPVERGQEVKRLIDQRRGAVRSGM